MLNSKYLASPSRFDSVFFSLFSAIDTSKPRTMNLSLAISFLLTTSAASYVTNVLSSNKGVPGKLSANALGYSISESETELSTAPTQEDLDFEALARLLGYQDNVIRSHYAAWCARYEKKPDETRYCNFKKNFLLQEDYNRQTRQTFDLNMYGDMTEGMLS